MVQVLSSAKKASSLWECFFFPGIQVINLGVRQGYVLGPILFFSFILLILAVPPHTFPHPSLLRILHSLYVAKSLTV